ncbi:MAG: GtrA family protein [Isosphaeraceae bacterium]|nr:GtrA family protein [Isosphaeraceae bacterium]
MARVSLIVPVAAGATPTGEGLERFCQALEHQGHAVELIVPEGRDGLAAAVDGLRAAAGDVLVVLDPTRGYAPDGLARVIAPVVRGEAELAIATREGRGGNPLVRAAMRMFARPLLGISEPGTGLVALTRRAARAADDDFRPIGDRFALELLARVEGRRREIPLAVRPPAGRNGLSLKVSDLRHVKRLADDRFGNLSRLVQFCMVGASGMVVDLTCYALFQLLFSHTGLTQLRAPFIGGTLDLATAGALAIAVALVWNFSLNRRLTFSYARQGSLPRQFLTYALSNALGIALSLTLRLFLPLHVGFFQRHRLAAAVVGIVTATGISFSMSRWVVFRRQSAPVDATRLSLAEAALAEPSAAPVTLDALRVG